MKTTFVESLVEGNAVQDIFIVTEKTISNKKDGQPFLQIRLTDRTGSIRGVLWDNVETFSSGFKQGDYVKIQGRVTAYRSELQLTIISVQKILIENVEPSDFLPMTQRDPVQMFSSLQEQSKTIVNKDLKKILQTFWSDDKFVQKFCIAPAAKKMHHAYLGGLLEHTLSVSRLVDRLIQCHYRGIDRDLLLTGAILHDIGKIHEFEYATMIDYSDEGRLLSHIIIGMRMLDEKIALITDFPAKTAQLLRHMIASHHGKRLFGSPEPPKTLEAMILHYLDDLDSKIMGVRDFMEKSDVSEDWTPYNYPMERQFYKGKL
ncbi:HDIG domain protein [Candidatus Magnetomorum sp. HK-1]|nr:HDIG domain protein [Candidatus Magnetomorum sp. HK-1]